MQSSSRIKTPRGQGFNPALDQRGCSPLWKPHNNHPASRGGVNLEEAIGELVPPYVSAKFLSRKSGASALVCQGRECYERQSFCDEYSRSSPCRDRSRDVSMTERKSYGRQLRAIGQSLEAQRIRIFKLYNQGERFVV